MKNIRDVLIGGVDGNVRGTWDITPIPGPAVTYPDLYLMTYNSMTNELTSDLVDEPPGNFIAGCAKSSQTFNPLTLNQAKRVGFELVTPPPAAYSGAVVVIAPSSLSAQDVAAAVINMFLTGPAAAFDDTAIYYVFNTGSGFELGSTGVFDEIEVTTGTTLSTITATDRVLGLIGYSLVNTDQRVVTHSLYYDSLLDSYDYAAIDSGYNPSEPTDIPGEMAVFYVITSYDLGGGYSNMTIKPGVNTPPSAYLVGGSSFENGGGTQNDWNTMYPTAPEDPVAMQQATFPPDAKANDLWITWVDSGYIGPTPTPYGIPVADGKQIRIQDVNGGSFVVLTDEDLALQIAEQVGQSTANALSTTINAATQRSGILNFYIHSTLTGNGHYTNMHSAYLAALTVGVKTKKRFVFLEDTTVYHPLDLTTDNTDINLYELIENNIELMSINLVQPGVAPTVIIAANLDGLVIEGGIFWLCQTPRGLPVFNQYTLSLRDIVLRNDAEVYTYTNAMPYMGFTISNATPTYVLGESDTDDFKHCADYDGNVAPYWSSGTQLELSNTPSTEQCIVAPGGFFKGTSSGYAIQDGMEVTFDLSIPTVLTGQGSCYTRTYLRLSRGGGISYDTYALGECVIWVLIEQYENDSLHITVFDRANLLASTDIVDSTPEIKFIFSQSTPGNPATAVVGVYVNGSQLGDDIEYNTSYNTGYIGYPVKYIYPTALLSRASALIYTPAMAGQYLEVVGMSVTAPDPVVLKKRILTYDRNQTFSLYGSSRFITAISQFLYGFNYGIITFDRHDKAVVGLRYYGNDPATCRIFDDLDDNFYSTAISSYFGDPVVIKYRGKDTVAADIDAGIAQAMGVIVIKNNLSTLPIDGGRRQFEAGKTYFITGDVAVNNAEGILIEDGAVVYGAGRAMSRLVFSGSGSFGIRPSGTCKFKDLALVQTGISPGAKPMLSTLGVGAFDLTIEGVNIFNDEILSYATGLDNTSGKLRLRDVDFYGNTLSTNSVTYALRIMSMAVVDFENINFYMTNRYSGANEVYDDAIDISQANILEYARFKNCRVHNTNAAGGMGEATALLLLTVGTSTAWLSGAAPYKSIVIDNCKSTNNGTGIYVPSKEHVIGTTAGAYLETKTPLKYKQLNEIPRKLRNAIAITNNEDVVGSWLVSIFETLNGIMPNYNVVDVYSKNDIELIGNSYIFDSNTIYRIHNDVVLTNSKHIEFKNNTVLIAADYEKMGNVRLDGNYPGDLILFTPTSNLCTVRLYGIYIQNSNATQTGFTFNDNAAILTLDWKHVTLVADGGSSIVADQTHLYFDDVLVREQGGNSSTLDIQEGDVYGYIKNQEIYKSVASPDPMYMFATAGTTSFNGFVIEDCDLTGNAVSVAITSANVAATGWDIAFINNTGELDTVVTGLTGSGLFYAGNKDVQDSQVYAFIKADPAGATTTITTQSVPTEVNFGTTPTREVRFFGGTGGALVYGENFTNVKPRKFVAKLIGQVNCTTAAQTVKVDINASAGFTYSAMEFDLPTSGVDVPVYMEKIIELVEDDNVKAYISNETSTDDINVTKLTMLVTELK